MTTDLATLDLDQLHELRGRVGGNVRVQVDELIAMQVAELPEKEIQRRIVQRLGKLGVIVYSLSQPRATKQSLGLPDLCCFDPVRGMFWIEVKAADGKLRDEQRVFQELCEKAGVGHVTGGLAEVEAFLRHDEFPADDFSGVPF